jgi:hypothetical protein
MILMPLIEESSLHDGRESLVQPHENLTKGRVMHLRFCSFYLRYKLLKGDAKLVDIDLSSRGISITDSSCAPFLGTLDELAEESAHMLLWLCSLHLMSPSEEL